MIVDELQIWEAVLDPVRDSGQNLISVFVAVADHRAGEDRRLMCVLVIDLRRGNIEILVERGKQRLQPTALFLKR